MFSLQNYTRDYKKQAEFGVIPTDTQIKRIQEISLEMYKDILKVCQQNNLTIMMGGGSALGAIRHKGFIPWDDDMDLIMPREDYDKFIELFDKSLGYKYKLVSPKNTSGGTDIIVRVVNPNYTEIGLFYNPEVKVPGIYMDINALDSVPNFKFAYYSKGIVANLLLFLANSKMMCLCKTKHSSSFFTQSFSSRIYYYSRLLLGYFLWWISYQKLCYYYDRFIASNILSKNVSIPSGRKHYFGETLSAKVFLPVKEVLFEDTKAFVPNDYDTYLKNLYGDNYMEIPPVEKREPHLYIELKV